MMNLRRRFVNLVAENCTSRVCSLHRLDVSEHLFYPSTAEAEAAARIPAVVSTLASLPAPTHSFRPAVAGRLNNIDEHIFALANPRRSEGRIFWRSQEGHTIVHDVDSHTTWSMPSGLRFFFSRPGVCPFFIKRKTVASATLVKAPLVISAPVSDADADGAPEEQEDLFVMCSNTGYLGFQVLRFDHSKPKPFNPRTFTDADLSWEWDRLPPPPLSEGSEIYTHAVLDGGRIICVSAARLCRGTYLFDTVKREWMRQATSDWQMPFFGAPQYVPDLKLWLGVYWSGDYSDVHWPGDDRDRYHLCASSDLEVTCLWAKRRRQPGPKSTTLPKPFIGSLLAGGVSWPNIIRVTAAHGLNK